MMKLVLEPTRVIVEAHRLAVAQRNTIAIRLCRRLVIRSSIVFSIVYAEFSM